MPTATDTFQSIAGNGPGPFTQFLRPNIPLDYGAQPFTPTSASGYESATTGAGKTILSFLKSVGDQRRALAEREDANTQTGIDNFQRHVAGLLANPDLTDAGREAIRSQADQIMNQHMHYAMKDVPKDGIHGIIKNVITQATGGPMKVREPINWDQATGQITNAQRPEHSQDYNYKDIVTRGMAAIEAMKQAKANYVDPSTGRRAPQPVTQIDYQNTWKPFYFEAQTKAPNYADKLWGAAAAGAMQSGSPEWYQAAYAPPPRSKTGAPPAGAAVPTTAQPPAYSSQPVADTGIHAPQGGGYYPALRSGPQHPLLAAAMPLPSDVAGALTPPSSTSYFPSPIADTGISGPQGGGVYPALRSGAQYPLTAAAMPLAGVSSAVTGPLTPPDFTQPRQAAGSGPTTAGPAVGSTVRTKDGTFKIKAHNPDGTIEIE